MSPVDTTYGEGVGDMGSLAISVFADRDESLNEIRKNVLDAGFSIFSSGPAEQIQTSDQCYFGDVVLLDCVDPLTSRTNMLARIDSQASKSGARLIISTRMDLLEDVFGSCKSAKPEIQIDPGRIDRLIALGRLVSVLPESRLRELVNDDRSHLLRLTEQIAQIAEKLDRLTSTDTAADRPNSSSFIFARNDAPSSNNASEKLVRNMRPPLPDPRLVRKIIQQRQLRARFFDGDLFADPAWDMLLDLTAARVEHVRVSVTSLCIASGVPPTTALRWISQMTDAGLLERIEDETDRRRAFIQLTDKAVDAMSRYFYELGKTAAQQV